MGSRILTLITNPESAPALARLAAAIARPVGGEVIPMTATPRDPSPGEREAAHQLVIAAERVAHARGVSSRGVVAHDEAVDEAVLEVAEERSATLVLMGWQGRSTHRNVFGEIIDSVVGRSHSPLLVARLRPAVTGWNRVLLTVTPENLARGTDTGLRLAATVSDRLRREVGSFAVLRSGESTIPLPTEIAGSFAPVHHDPRRHDLAVAAAARPSDLIILPVAGTTRGLRGATHLAWAAPDSSLLVVIPATHARQGLLAQAVRHAGTAPTTLPAEEVEVREHTVVVHARLPAGHPLDLQRVADAFASVGRVAEASLWRDGSRECAELAITTPASDQNSALGTVMTVLHELPGLDGAEFRYDLPRVERIPSINGAG